MKKFIQQKLKDQKGMTLIELLAVIVIIAIIAAIAIPAIGNIIENSRVGAIKSDALNAISAADLYYADNPGVAGPVTITTLKSGYLKDAGSLVDDGATPGITKAGLITAKGTVGTVSITFTGADKKAISGTPNNSPSAAYVNATHNGVGTVTIAR